MESPRTAVVPAAAMMAAAAAAALDDWGAWSLAPGAEFELELEIVAEAGSSERRSDGIS
jgi:hypothetical protein